MHLSDFQVEVLKELLVSTFEGELDEYDARVEEFGRGEYDYIRRLIALADDLGMAPSEYDVHSEGKRVVALIGAYWQESMDFINSGGCGWGACPQRYDWTWHHNTADALFKSGDFRGEREFEARHPERDPD